MSYAVAPCPICTWRSEPLPVDEQAREARRAHLTQHTQAELVEYVALLALARLEHYDMRVDAGRASS